jgi:hypothetical protein
LLKVLLDCVLDVLLDISFYSNSEMKDAVSKSVLMINARLSLGLALASLANMDTIYLENAALLNVQIPSSV